MRDILDVKQRLKRGNRLRELARHPADQGRIAADCSTLGLLDLESKAKIETRLLAARAADRQHASRPALRAGGSEGARDLARRPIHLQLFRLPIAPRSLGARAVVPDHADPSAQHAARSQRQLVDITCDSDGKVSKFIDLQDVSDTLPLHRIIPGEMYYLGVFMVGAYQDIMGDLHNLFGRVNEVHVFLDPDEESGWYIEEVIEGSTIGEVLAMTQWDKVELMRLLKTQVDSAIKATGSSRTTR